MTRGILGISAAFLLLQGCSARTDEQLVGTWVEWHQPHGSIDALQLEPDHTFASLISEIALSCRFPDSHSETQATGRWRFDRDNLRLELDYDPPALEKCKLPEVRTLVVDSGGGETDLLIHRKSSNGHAYRIRLMRPKPSPPRSAASLASTQVQCFRAHGEWGRQCLEPEAKCYTKFRDAGKACTDSSQCEGLCLADMVTVCEPNKGCQDPEVPVLGQPFVGICQRTDQSCGSFIEIHKGRADSPYDVD